MCDDEAAASTERWHTCATSPTPRSADLRSRCMELLSTSAAERDQTAAEKIQSLLHIGIIIIPLELQQTCLIDRKGSQLIKFMLQ